MFTRNRPNRQGSSGQLRRKEHRLAPLPSAPEAAVNALSQMDARTKLGATSSAPLAAKRRTPSLGPVQGPVGVMKRRPASGISSKGAQSQTSEQAATARPSERVYTVNCMLGAGTIFTAMRDELRNPRGGECWVDLPVDTAPPKPGSNPCCCRIDGTNLFLGDKSTAEQMVNEARVVAMRYRRMSSAVGDPSALCAHKRKLMSRAADRQSCAPNVTICNYFLGLKKITLKAKMVATLCNAYSWKRVFEEITPQTFVIYPRKALVDERHHWEQAMERPHAAHPDNMWVIKASHGCKGTGICLLNAGNTATRRESVGIILDHVDGQPEVHPWVVQRYVARPFLIRGRKFDLRVWTLITPDMSVYLYRDGVCRMSSELYNATDLSNRLIHLTNHCLQAKGPNYGKYERGNELPLDAMDDELQDRKGRDGRKLSYQTTVRPQIVDIVLSTLKAVREHLVVDPMSSVSSFQLLGYDFIIDEDLHVWLLEVNGSPGVADYLLRKMARHTVELVVDPVLAASRGRQGSVPSADNAFELLEQLA